MQEIRNLTAELLLRQRLHEKIHRFTARSRNWQILGTFFDWGVPILACIGGLIALFGGSVDKSVSALTLAKVVAAIVALVVTLLSSLRTALTPSKKVEAADACKEKFISFENDLLAGLEKVERQYKGQSNLDGARLLYFDSKREHLDKLIQDCPVHEARTDCCANSSSTSPIA